MRQDLRLENQAQQAGWKVEKSKSSGVPHVFSKGNVRVWECIHNNDVVWAKAVIVNNRYTQHIYNTNLAVVLGI